MDQLTCSLPRWRDANVGFCICSVRPRLLAAQWWVRLADATLAFEPECMGYLQQQRCSNAARIFGGCIAGSVLLHFIILLQGVLLMCSLLVSGWWLTLVPWRINFVCVLPFGCVFWWPGRTFGLRAGCKISIHTPSMFFKAYHNSSVIYSVM